jgi:formylglycine-generating enzyme required for sulfatase activity
VPAGPFWMGCDDTRHPGCASFEQPFHRVDVPAFRVDRLEVTVGEFEACVAAGACASALLVENCDWKDPARANRPVHCITRDQARSYCAWKDARLCTEAEWEKAARGGCAGGPDCREDARTWPWGDAPPDCTQVVSHDGCLCDPESCDVGLRPAGASPYGPEDLAGNAAEWVEDCWQDGYEGAPVDGSARTACPGGGGDWIARGGSFSQVAAYLRVSMRFSSDANPLGVNIFGARCCRAP